MGKSMDHRACEWVRARLPLLAGDLDGDQAGESRENGDLTPEEWRRIERHVATCGSCRQHQAALQQALAALAAAAMTPAETEFSSLWPTLERRIARDGAHIPSGWLTTGRRLAKWRSRGAALLSTAQARARDLQLAWVHDTLLEILMHRKKLDPVSRRKLGLVSASSMLAAVVMLLIGVPVLRKQWMRAQSTIVTNAEPLTQQNISPPLTDEPAEDGANLDSDDEASTNRLADADPARAPETSGAGADTSPASRPAHQIRFGYEVDHGTPTPPDTRESKPVY
jgi:hypothetical protein